jgi:hypothetical protein
VRSPAKIGRGNGSDRRDVQHQKERVMADEKEERGQPAGFDPRTGEVHGSGAGAGGNNPAEDYDDDPISGGGREPVGGPRPREDAAERPIDLDEGV